MDLFFILILIVINIILIITVYWQAVKLNQLPQLEETVQTILQDISQIVNHNADAQKVATNKILEHEAKIDFIIPLLDAHGQILRIYRPILEGRLPEPDSVVIGDIENFGE